MKKVIVVSGMAVVLAACSSSPVKQPEGNPNGLVGNVIYSSIYQCGDASVIATITDKEELLLERGKQINLLKQQIAASGAKYGGDAKQPDLVFWTKGDTAFMEEGGKSVDCRETNNLMPLQLRGNEPGWFVSYEKDATRVNLRYGQTKLNLPAAVIERDGKRWRYTASDKANTVTAVVDNALCVDSMSGMTYPMKATVTMGEQSYSGCAGNPALVISGTPWTVTHINGAPVQGDVNLKFDTSEQLSGSAGCNRFFTSYNLSGEDMRVGRIATSRMACTPALMQQESRFTKLLESVYQFEIKKDGSLVLRGDKEQEIKARR